MPPLVPVVRTGVRRPGRDRGKEAQGEREEERGERERKRAERGGSNRTRAKKEEEEEEGEAAGRKAGGGGGGDGGGGGGRGGEGKWTTLAKTHTKSAGAVLPSLGLCLGVHGYRSRRIHV